LNTIEAAAFGQFDASMSTISVSFASDSNTFLSGVESDVNINMFGWVNTTTVTLNTTINNFYDGLTGAINSTFDGTPLAAPALGIIGCLIGSKVAGIEKALTFIHDHAHLTLPRVSQSILVPSSGRTSELLASVSPSGSNGVSNSIIDKIISRYLSSLSNQRQTALVFIGLWLVVVIIAICTVLWNERQRGPRPVIDAEAKRSQPTEMEPKSEKDWERWWSEEFDQTDVPPKSRFSRIMGWQFINVKWDWPGFNLPTFGRSKTVSKPPQSRLISIRNRSMSQKIIAWLNARRERQVFDRTTLRVRRESSLPLLESPAPARLRNGGRLGRFGTLRPFDLPFNGSAK